MTLKVARGRKGISVQVDDVSQSKRAHSIHPQRAQVVNFMFLYVLKAEKECSDLCMHASLWQIGSRIACLRGDMSPSGNNHQSHFTLDMRAGTQTFT